MSRRGHLSGFTVRRTNVVASRWTSGRPEKVILILIFVVGFSGMLSTSIRIVSLASEKALLDEPLAMNVVNTRVMNPEWKSIASVPPVKPRVTGKRPLFPPRNYPGQNHKRHPQTRNTSSLIIDIDDPILTPFISWDNSPVVLEDFQLLFFTTPKVGSTVFKQLFRRMMKIEEWLIDDGFLIPHSPVSNGLTYLFDYRQDRVEDILTNPNWTRAIFTRDPMERTLSAYLDKGAREDGAYVKNHCCGIKTPNTLAKKQVVVGGNHHNKDNSNQQQQQQQRPWVAKHQERNHLLGIPAGVPPPAICSQLNATTPVTWETFVLHLLPHCTEEEHWKSQVSPALRWINFVGRFDRLAVDTRRMLERVGAWEEYGATGWPGGAIFETNVVRHKTSSQEYFARYYANRTIRKAVQEVYRQDYEHPLLNHTFPQL